MQRLFGSAAAMFVGLLAAAPAIDVEQLKSDAAGAVAYAALAQAAPVPPPQPVKANEQKETKVTKTSEEAAAEAPTFATGIPAGVPVPAPLPPSPPVQPTRTTFAPARGYSRWNTSPTLYYAPVRAPLKSPTGNFGPTYSGRWRFGR